MLDDIREFKTWKWVGDISLLDWIAIGSINDIRTSRQKLRGCIVQSFFFAVNVLHYLCRDQ